MNGISYRIIEKIAQTGSLTRTAEAFNYSQSRVSQILKAAEEETGVTFFVRTRTGVFPTAECQALLPTIRELVLQEQTLFQQIHALKQVHSGTIRIGAFTSLSCHWLPAKLKQFGELYPGIRYEVELGDQQQICDAVRTGTLDFGLITEPKSQDLRFLPVMEDYFSVIVPPDHPMVEANGLTLEQLQQERFILLQPEDNGSMEELLQQAAFQPNIPFRIKDDYTIMSMVENGLGISILPHLVINRAPYRIREIPLQPAHNRLMGIVLPADAPPSAAAGKLISFLLPE